MKINFNICRRFDSAGTSCTVSNLESFDNSICASLDKETGNLYGLQVFDCGYRISKHDTELWNHWNGCIFVDLDSKKAPGNHDSDFWNHFEANLHTFLSERHYANYYWMQRSASGKSFHICFFYNIDPEDKTPSNFIKLSKYSTDIVKSACDWMGLVDWKDTDGVFDTHQEVSVQLLYLSGYPIYYNPAASAETFAFSGVIDLSSIEEVQVSSNSSNLPEECTPVEVIISSDKYNIIPNNKYTEFDWEHSNRLRLASVLAKYFGGDRDKAWACYKEVIPTMMRQNHGTFARLQSLFNSQFNGIVRSNFNLSRAMIEFAASKFSLDIAVKQDSSQQASLADFNEFIADETVNLSETEFISDYYDSIISMVEVHENVYIKGGCGIGKSYFFKKLMRTEEKVIIVCHLNSIKNSVYALEICGEDNPLGVEIPSSQELRKMIATNSLPDKVILGWDQFAILAEKSVNLDSYYKCFDEIHNFVTTLNYRHSTTWSIIKNRDLQKRCILVSATPSGETNAFCSSSCYRFEFDKPVSYTVKYHAVTFDNADSSKVSVFDAVNNTARKLLERHIADKVVIFDNHDHAKYAAFWKNEACHYCKGNKNLLAVKKLSETNDLKQQVFITTVYGTEGIEIKNPVNNIAVLIPVRDITDTLVEQLINRFRDKQHVDVFFFDTARKQSSKVDTFYDTLINGILEGMRSDNPEYLHWYEKENYYLTRWLYWPNTEIKEYIETFPKMVMIYHNYLLKHSLNFSNIMEKYNIDKVRYLTYDNEEQTTSHNDIVAKLLAKYPQLVFERNDEDNCRELIAQFKSETVSYDEIRSLRDAVGYLHNLYDSFGGDTNIKSLWNDNSSENICRIANSDEGKFLVKLMAAFTNRGLFRLSTLKRFIKARKLVKSECITEAQKVEADKDIKWYNKQIERLEIKDNLNSNLYSALYWELINAEFNDKGERKKSNMYKGQAVNKKYTCIDNPFVEFTSHEECYEYLKKEGKISCTLSTYIKKGVWKTYFMKG